MEYLSPAQSRAARAILGWSQPDLAQRCSIHVQTISAFESESGTPTKRTLGILTETLEKAGIEFLPHDGVARRKNPVTVYEGMEGFRTFLDDVYNTLKDTSNGNVVIFNSKPANWLKWLGDDWYYNFHCPRMVKIKDRYKFRIVSEEGDSMFIGSGFAEYRWCPKGIFDERSIYVYGSKLAFLDFREDNVEVTVMNNQQFADGLRVLFDIAWKHVIMIPSEQTPIKKDNKKAA